MAERHQVPSVVFSILYPMEYYHPSFPGLLITPTERAKILQEYVDEVYFLDLPEISHLSPEEFVAFLKDFGVVAVVVGDDFKFGRGGIGDIETLRELSAEMNMEIQVVEEIRCNGERISSSRIRKLIRNGKVREASELLGRPYVISGKVYRDRGLGRKLGFPTANIDRGFERLVIPKSGVYFSKVRIGEDTFFGVTNIGIRPTIGGEDVIKYETHILNFNEDIYGFYIEVEILDYMREELKFSSLEELRDAIAEDVKMAKELIEAWSKK
jgi:riboflavin kinase/FMN adenylyltransferase